MNTEAKRATTAVSVSELILSGISSWLIGKLLDSIWRRSKKAYAKMKPTPALSQLLTWFVNIMAMLMHLHPADLKLLMDRAAELDYSFKDFFRSFDRLLSSRPSKTINCSNQRFHHVDKTLSLPE